MQITLHPPQLVLLLWRLTHTPLQLVVPVGQAQRPAVQVDPPEQVTPQAPQLLLSVCGLTQAPAQATWPAGR